MAGTQAGGRQAAETNRRLHGENFYREIGRKGGSNGTRGGFGAGESGREQARKAGAIGGKKSKRGPAQTYLLDGKQMSIVEIAVELGVSRNTVRNRIEKYGNPRGFNG